MNIKISSTNKELSSLGGLIIDNDIFNKIGLRQELEPLLPQNKIKTNSSSVDKFRALMFGLIAGADCLDDMNELAHDLAFSSTNDDKVNSANTYGDFLRSFSHLQCKELNELLIKTSLKLRNHLLPNHKEFVLDIDSFSSEQTGQKIEGVGFNYDNKWCLDTLSAFDQFGFPYYLDVRSGSTHTSQGACQVIHMIFKHISKKANKYLRADSGYCNMDVFNACNAASVKFVIKLRQDIASAHLRKCKNWKLSKHIKFKDGRDCEIAETVYYPSRSHRALRIVYIRALKQMYQKPLIWTDDCYDYTAWVTNMGSHEMSCERIILFYRGRGNAENYIKELKGGFDLRHYPCQKLVANKVYGLIATFAHAFMRFKAFLLDKTKLRYSKSIRFKMVSIACQVVRHARNIEFRFNNFKLREVTRWLKQIQHMQFGFG